jgi:hypothetical protein
MTFSNEIIKMFEYLGAKFGIAIDWTSQNVIPYINQIVEKYITWEIATSTFWICFAGVFCIVGILLWIFDVVYWDEFIGTMFGIVIIVVAVFTIGTQAYDIITCKYFPELQIIEYIKHLSNTVK